MSKKLNMEPKVKLRQVISAVFQLNSKQGVTASEINSYLRQNYQLASAPQYKKALLSAVKEGFVTLKNGRYFPSNDLVLLKALRGRGKPGGSKCRSSRTQKPRQKRSRSNRRRVRRCSYCLEDNDILDAKRRRCGRPRTHSVRRRSSRRHSSKRCSSRRHSSKRCSVKRRSGRRCSSRRHSSKRCSVKRRSSRRCPVKRCSVRRRSVRKCPRIKHGDSGEVLMARRHRRASHCRKRRSKCSSRTKRAKKCAETPKHEPQETAPPDNSAPAPGQTTDSTGDQQSYTS